MSDPVTNVEIEDVLSSIRRLVSEDSRPESTSEAPPAQRSAPAGRLVLTPALRVQEAPASDEMDSDSPETDEEERMRHAAPVAARLVPAEEEVAEAARRAPLRPVAPEAAPETPVSDEIEEAPFIEVDEHSEGEFAESSIADFFALKLRDSTPPQPAPVADAGAREGSLAQKIAELEEMIARSTHEFEPERGEAAPEAIFRHQPGEEPAPSVDVEDEDPELASRPMPEPELVDEPYALVTLAPPEAEPEVEVEAVEDEFEDIVVGAQAMTATLSEAEEDAAEELQAEPEPAPRRPVKILRNPVWQRSQSNLRSDAPAPELPAAPVAEAPSVAGIDEERLRALITEVVREELQGALGERATRNVRRLVRRELQRLLASDDLD
ncbi:hypothetical protein LCM08_22610 [Salipiger pacificus]|nr:hypothetical protein [Alloyangia pacifica]MCA0947728.1 hypothetical protein [Alloyangia pacifica]